MTVAVEINGMRPRACTVCGQRVWWDESNPVICESCEPVHPADGDIEVLVRDKVKPLSEPLAQMLRDLGEYPAELEWRA